MSRRKRPMWRKRERNYEATAAVTADRRGVRDTIHKSHTAISRASWASASMVQTRAEEQVENRDSCRRSAVTAAAVP